MATSASDIFQVLLESLKTQADKYKLIIDGDMTHEQRKDLDTEIKQMYELLSQMTNSTIILSSSEIESFKTQFQAKLDELQLILDNPNITTVKGDDGKSAYELALINGFVGSLALWLESLKGQDGINGQNGIDGKDFTFDMFTPEQLLLLKGEKGQDGANGLDGTHGLDGDDGLSAYQIAFNNGFTGSEIEWLDSLKGNDGLDGSNGQNGIDGKDFTFDMFTPEQLQLIANLVTVDLTSILQRITDLENQINSSGGGSVTPPTSTGNVILDSYISSYVPTLANSDYFYDSQIVVPENLTAFYNYYKFDFKLTDINNTYKVTFKVSYNNQDLIFVYDLAFNTEYTEWDIQKIDLESSILGDNLSFNPNLRNNNNLIFRVGFDCGGDELVAPFNFVCFIESDNVVSQLNVIEKRFDDDSPEVYAWLDA